MGDFPGGPVVKNSPSNAEDAGSIPSQGTKIPHAVGQLSPRAPTTNLTHSGARAPQLEKRKPARHNYREVRAPQRRSRVPQLRPDADKKNKQIN